MIKLNKSCKKYLVWCSQNLSLMEHLKMWLQQFYHSMILLAHFESAHDKAVPIFGNFVVEQTFDRWRICLILHRISVGLFDSLPAFSPGEKAPNVGIYWILCLDSIFFFFHCNFFTIPALSKKGLAWATKKSAFLIGWSQFGQHNLLFHIVHNMPIVLILLLSLAWLSMACCWMQNLATAKYVSRCKIKIPELSYLVTGTRSGRWFLPLLPQISN